MSNSVRCEYCHTRYSDKEKHECKPEDLKERIDDLEQVLRDIYSLAGEDGDL